MSEITVVEIQALRIFVKEGINSDRHKRILRKAGFIEYSHKSWSLSELGHREAVARGYLEPRATPPAEPAEIWLPTTLADAHEEIKRLRSEINDWERLWETR
jgi:hypothetical protein